jgi:hypothetical protein
LAAIKRHHLEVNVAYWPKADILIAWAGVRYWVKSGHHDFRASCPLLTQSGHERLRIAAEPHFAGNKSLL